MNATVFDMAKTSSREAYNALSSERPERVTLSTSGLPGAHSTIRLVNMLSDRSCAPGTASRVDYIPKLVSWDRNGMEVILTPGVLGAAPHHERPDGWDLGTFRSERVVREIKSSVPRQFTAYGTGGGAHEGIVSVVWWSLAHGGFAVKGARWGYDPEGDGIRMVVDLERGGNDE